MFIIEMHIYDKIIRSTRTFDNAHDALRTQRELQQCANENKFDVVYNTIEID